MIFNFAAWARRCAARVLGSVGGWCGAARGRGEPLRRSGGVQEKAARRMRKISYFGVDTVAS